MVKKQNKLNNIKPEGNAKGKPYKIIFCAIICVVLMITIIPRGKTIWDLSVRKKELEAEKAQLVQINTNRQKELAKTGSPEEVERIAREKLGMVKNGERVIMKVTQDK